MVVFWATGKRLALSWSASSSPPTLHDITPSFRIFSTPGSHLTAATFIPDSDLTARKMGKKYLQ
jgi:hypothetical protein